MKSDAWLLDCASGLKIAVSDREMIELVAQQDCQTIPGAPDYCAELLAWQGRLVPVMDLALLHGYPPADRGDAYICLLNYQPAPVEPLLPIGFRVMRAPGRITVDDEALCDWPDDLRRSRLRTVSICCFEHAGDAVLILDIARLCSAEFRDFATAAA